MLKRLNCKHSNLTFIRNIYGDEINYANCRSYWKCDRCSKWIGKLDLCKTPEAQIKDLAQLIGHYPIDIQNILLKEMGYLTKII